MLFVSWRLLRLVCGEGGFKTDLAERGDVGNIVWPGGGPVQVGDQPGRLAKGEVEGSYPGAGETKKGFKSGEAGHLLTSMDV